MSIKKDEINLSKLRLFLTNEYNKLNDSVILEKSNDESDLEEKTFDLKELDELTDKYVEIELKQEEIKKVFESIQTSLVFSELSNFENKIKEFETLYWEIELLNYKYKQQGIITEFDDKILSYQSKIYKITLTLIKNYENLIETKKDIIKNLKEDIIDCEKKIKENNVVITEEKEVLANLIKMKDIDKKNQNFYEDLITEKNDYISSLEFFNEKEPEIILTNIKILETELNQIYNQIQLLSIS